jgi:hypothetical protein
MQFGLPHLLVASIPWCVCTHPINATCVHLSHCAHGNERTCTHDVIHNIFVAIALDVDFHVGWKQLHTFRSSTFHFSHWGVDIVHQKWYLHLSQHYHCRSNLNGFTSLILCNFSITLQRMQTSSILSQAVAIGLAKSWLSPFQDAPPISTVDLLGQRNFDI